jgi:hypothetical protein
MAQPAPTAQPLAATATPTAASPPAGRRPPATRAAQPAAQTSPPINPDPDALTQARVVCWMKVEEQKALRNIDRRIAFVDKCIADALKP